MYKSLSLLVLILFMAGCSLAGVAGNQGCVISFDDGLRTNSGAQPVSAEGVSITQGKVAAAGVFENGAVLTYRTEGFYNPKRGSVQMWVKPNWSWSNALSDKVFWAVKSRTKECQDAVFRFCGDRWQRRIYFSATENSWDHARSSIFWKAGEWHHIAIYWDEEARLRALFIDGELSGIATHTVALPDDPGVFYIGGIVDANGAVVCSADAVIDEFELSSEIDNPEFDQMVKERKGLKAEHNRLSQRYTFERVTKEKLEVEYEDLSGMATPLSKRVLLHPAYHPDYLFLQPDMSISLGADWGLGIGFGVGRPVRLPDMWRVKRKLCKGYLPVVESEWDIGDIRIEQTAFGMLAEDERVVTGKEASYLFVRMKLSNSSNNAQDFPLFLLTGQMCDSQNTRYEAYLAPKWRWSKEIEGIKLQGQSLTMNDKALLVYQSDGPVDAKFYAKSDAKAGDDSGLDKFTNYLKFDIKLKANEVRTIDFVVSGRSELYPVSHLEAMKQMEFEQALESVCSYWDSQLEMGMKFTVPEKRLNDIYRSHILTNMQFQTLEPNSPCLKPYHWLAWGGQVWAWEYAHTAVPMMATGFYNEWKPTLQYFIERQNGIGSKSANLAAVGDIKSTRGSYAGNTLLWMNETGSVLWAMASYYRYSRDVEWLKVNMPSIVAAWDWIQFERARTRTVDADGVKVRHYGLLPSGRSCDLNKDCYQFTFSDSFTWKGMDEIAKAFREANLPEAARFTYEADEYRQCILDVMRKEEFVDPETGLLFVPNTVYHRGGGPHDPNWWHANGPVHMFDVGLLEPEDERFAPMAEYTKQKYGILMGLPSHVDGGMEWYPNQTERGYYKCFLGRGELEKSLLVLYSNLVYGMSNDTYQTSERFQIDNRNYAPFQPNPSGNSRNIDILRRMVIDEQDAEEGKLWLLRGCPRRWFAKGKSIMIEDACTLFGRMAVRMQSNGDVITVDIDSPSWKSPEKIYVAVRHPKRLALKKATVNGEPVEVKGETVIVLRPQGHLQVVCSY